MSKQIYSPFVVDRNVLKTPGCAYVIDEMLEIRVREIGSDEVLFTSKAWLNAFNINEPIYTEICQEFYATFEFDEAVADEDLFTEKVLKFRLGGKAHSMSMVDFTRHLDISSKDKLTLSRSSAKTLILQKMITYGLCQRTTGYDKIQKNDLWLLSMFEVNHRNGYANVTWVAKSLGVLEDDVLDGLNAPIYCKLLYASSLRELISSNGRLIPEETTPSIPRVSTPRVVRHTTSDMYDKIGQLETRINNIEGMMRRQSYHSNIYASVLEHIGAHQGTTLRDPYNPPNYVRSRNNRMRSDTMIYRLSVISNF
ncbi:hypothetical protein Tco_0960618 [Tanacetum coccineum]